MPPTTRSRAKDKQQDSDIEVVIKPATNERQVNNKRINSRKRRNHNEWKWNRQNKTIISNDMEDSDESVNTNNHCKTKRKATKTKCKSKKKKKNPTNSNKKWTLTQDEKLLKWMDKNPNHHKNKTKIDGLAGGLFRRSTTAVMSRIVLLKNAKQKSKQKHINTNNNNKNNNKNESDNDIDTKQNDYNRIFNVLQKLNNGYDTQKRLTENTLNKIMDNEMNINIKNCKNITGYRIEYWETQLKCLEKRINKISKFSKLPDNNNEESVSDNDEESVNGCDHEVLMDVNENNESVNSNNMVNDIEVDPNDLLRNPWLSRADDRPRKRRKFY